MKYKYADAEHTAVNNLETGQSFIRPGNYLWIAYLEWIAAGGVTEPFDSRSPDEIAAEEKAIAAKRIRDDGAAKLAALGNPYSEEEQKTWDTQEAEALAWMADNSAKCPLITGMAVNRGIPISLMVQKILENAELFKDVSGKILGLQQKALDQLG